MASPLLVILRVPFRIHDCHLFGDFLALEGTGHQFIGDVAAASLVEYGIEERTAVINNHSALDNIQIRIQKLRLHPQQRLVDSFHERSGERR